MHGKHDYEEPIKLEGKMDGLASYESDDNSEELGSNRPTYALFIDISSFQFFFNSMLTYR
jgi:hypothetical protein